MGVLHSTLQAEQNFPISIRSFFFFFPLEPVGEIHIEVHTKDGYKKTKKKKYTGSNHKLYQAAIRFLFWSSFVLPIIIPTLTNWLKKCTNSLKQSIGTAYFLNPLQLVPHFNYLCVV